MNNNLFPRTWRGEKNYLIENEENLSLGDAQYISFKKKYFDVLENILKSALNNYDIKIKADVESCLNDSSNPFTVEYEFNSKNYTCMISGLEIDIDNNIYKVFITVIQGYTNYFFSVLDRIIKKENNIRIPSEENSIIIDSILYNLHKTIFIEYLYHLFTDATIDDYNVTPQIFNRTAQYNIDYIQRIWDFSIELSVRKIENREINCGFIFHANKEHVNLNSVYKINIEEAVDFNSFEKIKNLVAITNGENIFFNVVNNKITDFFITNGKIKEIKSLPNENHKQFKGRPLVVSILGPKRILFIEGKCDKNKVLLEIINSKPVIRDFDYLRKKLEKKIKQYSSDELNGDVLKLFIDWIFSISFSNKGTSIFIGNFDNDISDNLIKYTKINKNKTFFKNKNKVEYDRELLSKMASLDGAVLFNNFLEVLFIGAILPISNTKQSTEGSARHNSAKSFSQKTGCLGITISDDSNITLFDKGEPEKIF